MILTRPLVLILVLMTMRVNWRVCVRRRCVLRFRRVVVKCWKLFWKNLVVRSLGCRLLIMCREKFGLTIMVLNRLVLNLIRRGRRRLMLGVLLFVKKLLLFRVVLAMMVRIVLLMRVLCVLA